MGNGAYSAKWYSKFQHSLYTGLGGSEKGYVNEASHIVTAGAVQNP